MYHIADPITAVSTVFPDRDIASGCLLDTRTSDQIRHRSCLQHLGDEYLVLGGTQPITWMLCQTTATNLLPSKTRNVSVPM